MSSRNHRLNPDFDMLQFYIENFQFTRAKKQLMFAKQNGATDQDISMYRNRIDDAERSFLEGMNEFKNFLQLNDTEGRLGESNKYLNALQKNQISSDELKSKIECAKYLQKTQKHLALTYKLLAQEYHDLTEIHCLIRETRSDLYLAKTFGVFSEQVTEYENKIRVVELIVGTEKNIDLAQKYHSKWYWHKANKCFDLVKQYDSTCEKIDKLQNEIDASALIFQTEANINITNDGDYLEKAKRHIVLAQDLLAQEYHDLTEIYHLITNARSDLNLAKTANILTHEITEYENKIKALEMIVGTEKNIALAQQCNLKWYLEEANKYISLAMQLNIPEEKVIELRNKIDAVAVMIQTECDAEVKRCACYCRNTKTTADMNVQTVDANNATLSVTSQNTNIAKPEKHAQVAVSRTHYEKLVDSAKPAASKINTSEKLEASNNEKHSAGEKPGMTETVAVLENLFENKNPAHLEYLAANEELLTYADKCNDLARKALTEGHFEIAMIIVIITKKLFPEVNISCILAEIAATSQKSGENIPRTKSPVADSVHDISKHMDKSVEDFNKRENLATNLDINDIGDRKEINEIPINAATNNVNNVSEIAIKLKKNIRTIHTDAETFNRVSEDTLNGDRDEMCMVKSKEIPAEKDFKRAETIAAKSDKKHVSENAKGLCEKFIIAKNYSTNGNPTDESHSSEMKRKDFKYPETTHEDTDQARKCLEIACTAFEEDKLERCKRFLQKAKNFDNRLNIECYLVNLYEKKVLAEIKKEQKKKVDAEKEKYKDGEAIRNRKLETSKRGLMRNLKKNLTDSYETSDAILNKKGAYNEKRHKSKCDKNKDKLTAAKIVTQSEKNKDSPEIPDNEVMFVNTASRESIDKTYEKNHDKNSDYIKNPVLHEAKKAKVDEPGDNFSISMEDIDFFSDNDRYSIW